MRTSEAAIFTRNNPIIDRYGFEEDDDKRCKALEDSKDDAMRKVQEAQNANTQSTLKMMDRHIEMVKKSQELNNARARKQAIERLAQKRREEHSELLAEMAINNAKRRDLLEEAHLEKMKYKS